MSKAAEKFLNQIERLEQKDGMPAVREALIRYMKDGWIKQFKDMLPIYTSAMNMVVVMELRLHRYKFSPFTRQSLAEVNSCFDFFRSYSSHLSLVPKPDIERLIRLLEYQLWLIPDFFADEYRVKNEQVTDSTESKIFLLNLKTYGLDPKIHDKAVRKIMIMKLAAE